MDYLGTAKNLKRQKYKKKKLYRLDERNTLIVFFDMGRLFGGFL